MKNVKLNRKQPLRKKDISLEIWGGLVLNSYHPNFMYVSKIADKVFSYFNWLTKPEQYEIVYKVFDAVEEFFANYGYFKYKGLKRGKRKDLEFGIWARNLENDPGGFILIRNVTKADWARNAFPTPGNNPNKLFWFTSEGVLVPDDYLPGTQDDFEIESDAWIIKNNGIEDLREIDQVLVFAALALIKINEYAHWAEIREDTRDETDDAVWFGMVKAIANATEAIGYANEEYVEQLTKDKILKANKIDKAQFSDPFNIRDYLEQNIISARASSAGKAKSAKNAPLKKAVLDRFKEGNFRSPNNAAEIIWDEIQNGTGGYPVCYLTITRGRMTIYSWILAAAKNS